MKKGRKIHFYNALTFRANRTLIRALVGILIPSTNIQCLHFTGIFVLKTTKHDRVLSTPAAIIDGAQSTIGLAIHIARQQATYPQMLIKSTVAFHGTMGVFLRQQMLFYSGIL